MAKPGTSSLYYLGLGSNIGQRDDNLRRAIDLIDERIAKTTLCSPFIETEPWGYQSSHRYLNAAVALTSDRDPHEVLAITQQIEHDLGRTAKTRDGRYEDRPIDIDILICDRRVVYTPDLRLPHPRMWQRQFVLDNLAAISDISPEPRVATIGFFDGAHLGHQHLACQLAELNRGRSHPAIMLTFDRHPHDVVHPDEPPVPLLTTLAEKREQLLRNNGDIEMWFMEFGTAMAALTAREFMEQVLRDQLNIDTLLIGYDHHFGRPLPGETFDDYCRYGQELGIRLVRATELNSQTSPALLNSQASPALCMPPYYGGPAPAAVAPAPVAVASASPSPSAAAPSSPLHISSSAIRRAILAGDFSKANAMMGRPYSWWGRVVHGEAIGRRLGFPTANLEPKSQGLILPPRGVYAAWATIPAAPAASAPSPALAPSLASSAPSPSSASSSTLCMSPYYGDPSPLPAMVNIGTRPTITPSPQTSIEAHLIGFDGDLYGHDLCLTFVSRLRDERPFATEADLADQLRRDRDEVLRILNT